MSDSVKYKFEDIGTDQKFRKILDELLCKYKENPFRAQYRILFDLTKCECGAKKCECKRVRAWDEHLLEALNEYIKMKRNKGAKS